MGKLDDLVVVDALGQAELVRQKQIGPIELVEAAIERIERLNDALNAVITKMYEQGRIAASGKIPDGPFSGVPFLLKDLLASYGGVKMTAGSVAMRDFVPDHDSELVVRLKCSGLIIIGKTNTPEFGILPTTESQLLGPCHNPWDKSRTSGGSSGGSAAAVAAGLVPMAHANDGGGSIRIPASCCGVFGLKPTRARNSLAPDFGDIMSGLVVEHAITRSVRDSAALLDCTSGPATGEPYWAPPPTRPFLQEVGVNPGRLRIAFTSTAPTDVRIHPDCIAAVQDAVNLCAALGHEVVEAAPAIDGEQLNQSFIALWVAGCASMIDNLALKTGRSPSSEQFEPLTCALYELGSQQSASQYLRAVNALQRISRMVGEFFLEYDVWITPTLAEPPVPLGTFAASPSNPLNALVRAAAFVPFTPICNITGQPAMSVPLYWNGNGLPIGTHFVARFGDEATLFRLAAQLEAGRPWVNRRPPISA